MKFQIGDKVTCPFGLLGIIESVFSEGYPIIYWVNVERHPHSFSGRVLHEERELSSLQAVLRLSKKVTERKGLKSV